MSKSHVRRVRELYKVILRLHRSLPDDLKILGDNYAKDEFKRHKKCQPQEAQTFLNEWREYVVSMSRQVVPARAQRQPADEQQARSSTEARAARRAEEREVAARRAEERVAAARRGEERVAAAGRGEERVAAAGGAEDRVVDQQVPAEVRAAAATAANELINHAYAADAQRRLRFGNNLDLRRVQHFSQDQLLTLYRLSMTAQGNIQDEYGDGPTDIGIGLIDADIYANSSGDAKNKIHKIEESTEKSLEEAEVAKNARELRRAVNHLTLATKEAFMAKTALEAAEMEFEKATHLAVMARGEAKKAKTNQLLQCAGDPKNISRLNEAVMIALKEAEEAEQILQKVEKLLLIAKKKEIEKKAAAELALQFSHTIMNDCKHDTSDKRDDD